MRLIRRPTGSDRARLNESGSIPLALLVSIVVAGLVIVLTGTILQSERSVRFDRAYTDVVQTADAGVQIAYHRLNEAAEDPTTHPELAALDVGDVSPAVVVEHNGAEATWTVNRISSREFEITSTGQTDDDVARTVVVTVEKDSLFFPGAFGDRLVAMNGTSTQIDSYESRSNSCSPPSADTCWGTDADFGTRKAALGTNNDFDFSGNVKVLRGILYDWKNNPATGVTAANPGGSRCKGNPCNPDVLRTEDQKLEYGSDEQMQFITDKLQGCTATQERGNWVLGNVKKNDPPVPVTPFPGGSNDGSPADPTHTRYYCADSVQVIGDVVLDGASPDNPVVIFVRNSYSQAGHTIVGLDCLANGSCPGNFNNEWRNVRPKAESLQIYVQTEAPAKGANVMIDQHAIFAGVMYSPRATCGSSGNAGAHVYGSMICRNIDNVGNWRFHYDEALADATRGSFTVASWREEAPTG